MCLNQHLKIKFRARGASVPKMYREQDDMLARSTIETWVIKAEKGDANACPKCDGKVFEAEKMTTASVSTHCFKPWSLTLHFLMLVPCQVLLFLYNIHIHKSLIHSIFPTC